MLQYIYNEINYPTLAREAGIEGTVVVRFYIDEQGNIKAPEILKEIGGGCGKEALRVVKTMNEMGEKWTPGKQRGRAVKVYFNLPVKYKLN
jgi:protein TonB